MHPDALGNRVAATAILERLCALAWLPAASLECSGAAPANARDTEIERVVADALAKAAPADR
jgi:hypothetical protein